jgi:hypothetical protein
VRHETFDTGLSHTTVTRAALVDLNSIASELDACFVPVGQALLTLVETVDSVVHGLSDVRSAIMDGATDHAIGDLGLAATCLLETPSLQARRRNSFAELRSRIAMLNGLSADLDRVLHMLQFYSLNVKIAAGGAAEFVDFADEMRAQLTEGRSQLAHFSSSVAKLFNELMHMAIVDQQLTTECTKLIPSVPDQLTAAAESLRQQRMRVAPIVEAGEHTARSLKSTIGEALAAIQVGDSTRQRIEHVAYACEQIDGMAGLDDQLRQESEAQLAALCVAQIDAINSDFINDVRKLLTSLQNLLPDTKRLLESIRNQDSIVESAVLVGKLGTNIADSATLTDRLQVANIEADAILGTVVTTIADLSTRVEHVRDLGIEVGYMSVNANLRCRREQAISQPVSVIAREIKTHSRIIDELSGTFVGVADELAAISRRMSEGNEDGHFDVQERLAKSYAALQQASLRSERGVEKVSLDCDGLAEHLASTIVNLNDSLGTIARLNRVRDTLQPIAEAARPGDIEDEGHPLHSILRQIFSRYTMAQERVIHARFSRTSDAPVQVPSDDLDDGLF